MKRRQKKRKQKRRGEEKQELPEEDKLKESIEELKQREKERSRRRREEKNFASDSYFWILSLFRQCGGEESVLLRRSDRLHLTTHSRTLTNSTT